MRPNRREDDGQQWVQVLKVPGNWVQVRLRARCASKATSRRSSGAYVEAICWLSFNDVGKGGWICVKDGMGLTHG